MWYPGHGGLLPGKLGELEAVLTLLGVPSPSLLQSPSQREGAQAEPPPKHGIRDTSCQPPARVTPLGSGTGIYQPAQTELGTAGPGLSQQSPGSLTVVFDSLTLPSRPAARKWSRCKSAQPERSRMAPMAAQLVPCSPSVPRSSHRGHRQREAFLGAGQGTRSKLALHGGFPPGSVAGSALMPDTSAQAGWLRSLGEQAESSVPAPAEEGTCWASGKTQAPPSSPSFADPLSWHTQSACPGRGCCSTAGLSLLPSPCPPVLAPAHDTPLCAQAQGRALAAACKANFCTPAFGAAPELQPPQDTAAKPFLGSKGREQMPALSPRSRGQEAAQVFCC